MGKKCLVMYSSYTGNTEKVAMRFKETFIKNGWDCDTYKIKKRTSDVLNPPVKFDDYDFICVGSGVILHLPYPEVLHTLYRLLYGVDPRVIVKLRDQDIPYIKEPVVDKLPDTSESHKKIIIRPDSKKAVAFVTYAGYEFGPYEAGPAMQLLALEIEHFGFKCIGQFCCPGVYINKPLPKTFHGDIRNRPNERDLLKAEMFIEEKLEEIAR